MLSTRLILGAVLVAFSTAGAAATKPEAKPEAKAEAKPAAAKAAAKPPASPRLKGKQETLACRLGTEDRHARIAVVTIGGKVDSFAYYSKWKPRTCSVYLQRNRDMYSKWADHGNTTTVDIEKGAFLVEYRKNEYHFIFRDIDRERYCGMDGTINGTLTIRKGSEACELGGDIMVEGTPLGKAFVQREEDKAPVGLLPVTAQEAAKAPPDVSPPAVGIPIPAEKAPEGGAQPAASAAPAAAAPATAPAESTAKAPAAPAASAPAPAATTPVATTAPGSTTSVATTPATTTPAAKADTTKSTQPASTSPVRSFFRSLGESRGPEGGGRSE